MQQSRCQSYYAVLGVHPGASAAEIRAAYHRLAMRWHPDKVANGRRVDPALADEAKGRFQQIHEAYKVLSDEKRRALYNAGMYDPLDDDDQEEVEGFHDFLQEMVSLMTTVGKEEPVYTLGELQSMLDGMMKDFASPPPAPSSSSFFSSAGASRLGAPSEFQSMLDGMMKDFSSPPPAPSSSSFFSSAGASRLGAQQPRSSRVHPQRFGSSACFSRTAFSGC